MSMSQGGESGQSWETDQQIDGPGRQWQGGVPSQGNVPVPGQAGPPGPGGTTGPGGTPSRPWTGEPQAQQYGSPPPPPERGMPDQWGVGPMQARPVSPVNEIATRVTGRRVIQYIIDYIITAVVAAVIMWALDRGTGAANAVLLLVGAILVAAWYFWYWVYRPYHANGQSLGMQLLGVRIISKDGGRASMMQLLIRGILLIVDTLIWGLVGFITIICSRYRQRVGDHAAKTVVVRRQVEAMPARREYAGMAGSR
jgi:uncharacterized RDD family membrane protein YckC